MSDISASVASSRPPSAILLPTLAIVACILCLPILAHHVKSRNLAASMQIFWIVLENVFNIINPLLWSTSDFHGWWNGVGLCDVESKLRLAAYIGYISALVCIYRQLAIILNTEQIVLFPSPSQRRFRTAIEITLCLGFPIYIMIAHYLVQSGRYYIFPITGCVPILDSSWPSTALVLIWPGAMWIVAAAYCSVIIYRLAKYRRQVSSILSAPHSQYNQSQFVRVFAMATTLIVIFLPVALYLLVQNVAYKATRLSYSWSRIHDWTDSIYRLPSSDGENIGRWLEVVTGFVVFLSFGVGSDGLLLYRGILLKAGLGRIFPGLMLPQRQEAHLILQSGERIPLVNRFGSISSRARLTFHRRFANDTSLNPDTAPSTADSVSSPTPDAEKGLGHILTPPQPTYDAGSFHIQVQNTQSAQQSLSFPQDKPCSSMSNSRQEDTCTRPLVQNPVPARTGSAT